MQKKDGKNNQSKLCGIVLPIQWDENGNIIRISLNTSDEKAYVIDYSGRGRELLNHLQDMIEVDGKVQQRLGGSLYLKVNNYTVIQELKKWRQP